MRYLMFLFCFVLNFASCVDIDDRLVIFNESNKTIAYERKNDLNDTLENRVEYYLENYLKPQESKKIELVGGLQDSWESYINRNPKQELYIYFFNLDTLKKYKGIYTLNQICNSKLLDTILTFKKEELERNDWKVVYKDISSK